MIPFLLFTVGKFQVQKNWTLVLNFDPSWIGNSQNCIAVTGYIMTTNPYPIAPWIPPGTQ